MFFIRRGISPEVLRCLESLLLEHEKRNKWLESENLRLIGLAYPLTGSPKNEALPMNHEDEQRAINLADAAGRAINNGLAGLSEKLAAEAEKLMAPIIRKPISFEDYAKGERLSIEKRSDIATDDCVYLSIATDALYKCWKAAGGPTAK